MEIELSNIVFIILGGTISIIAYFLKRENTRIERIGQKLRRIEVALAENGARDSERWIQTQRLLEDRREDVIKIFEQINKKN
tara:strand:+ start:3642 stop:3887 length:246 start_codon:yes stop_codon:yes gene_type:complete